MVLISLSAIQRFGSAAAAAPRRPARSGSIATVAISVGVPLALGQAMGIWSAPDVATWYQGLDKPSWTPPVWAFPIVWTGLYAAQGLGAHRACTSGAGATTMGLYLLQLGLNLAWQPIFFKTHNLKAAAYDITALLGLLSLTTLRFHKLDPLAGRLMLPYLAFSAFAAALTYDIAARNGAKVE